MNISRLEIDSKAFGCNVLEFHGSDFTDFSRFEAEYLERFKPFYVFSKVPSKDLAKIHALESEGFNFVEFQYKLSFKLRKILDTTSFNYSYTLVENEEELEAVSGIAASIFEGIDRYSSDPLLSNLGLSDVAGERYRQYLGKSFHSPDEYVYKFVDKETDEIVGFGSHRHLSSDKVLLYIGGVKKRYANTGLGAINDFFGYNALMKKGLRKGITHVSGSNTSIMNLEVVGLGHRVIDSYAVMRKLYLENLASGRG